MDLARRNREQTTVAPAVRNLAGLAARRVRDGLRLFVLALLLVSCGRGEERVRPNFVVVITDDQRADAMGGTSDLPLRTPAMDRLAAEGVRFDNAFVTTSLCSPSRASFFTGTYARVHGVLANETREPDPALPTFPELLQEAGYETAYVGKWHMLERATPRPGFDHWTSFTGQGEYARNTLNVDGEWVLDTEYVTDSLTERALAFLRQDHERPFLLVLSHKAAHGPFRPAPRHADAYADVPFAPLTDPDDDLARKPDWGGRIPANVTADQIRAYHQTLLAVDEGLARILDALEESAVLDHTVVVFTSDNGFLHGEHGGLSDKRAAYEPSIRVPLVLRYPAAVAPGAVVEEMVLNVDLAPTVLELAGIEPPATMQGRSWLPLLRGERGRDDFLYEYYRETGPVPTILAVRTRDWKYVTYPDDPRYGAELYDLRADPGELRNLIDDPRHADVVERLARRLAELQRETGPAPVGDRGLSP